MSQAQPSDRCSVPAQARRGAVSDGIVYAATGRPALSLAQDTFAASVHTRPRQPRPMSAATWPVYRTIVAVDMENSTLRTNPVKEEFRRRVYHLLDRALYATGIRSHHLDRLTDRGDGVLALVRPADDVPKTLLLDMLIPTLSTLLNDYNSRTSIMERPERRLRLRAVIHSGEVHDDGIGFFGESLDVAFRLLDAPPVKKALRRTTAPLVLVISEYIFWSIVSQGYLGIDQDAYEPLVRVHVGGRRRRGWVHIPGNSAAHARQRSAAGAPSARVVTANGALR